MVEDGLNHTECYYLSLKINTFHHFNSPFRLAIGSVLKELDIYQVCYTTLLKGFCQFLIICPLKNISNNTK